MSNIKELIRQKIDAYYAEYKDKFHQNGDPYHLGIIDGLDIAERILDTLPDESEQPARGYDEAYLNEKIAKASKSWEGVDVDKFMDEIRGREPVTGCHDFESLFDEFCDAHPDGMTLEECGRFFFSKGFSRGKMVATNDFDLALAKRYLIGFNDGKREPVTDCHDLEKEYKEYVDNDPVFSKLVNRNAGISIARHFAEWGADHLRDTPKNVSEDLEDAAEKSWVDYEYREDPRGLYSSCYIDGFKAGAEWMKAKMMEGAVEGLICATITGTNAISFLSPLPKELTAGSEVRIIILPKEE